MVTRREFLGAAAAAMSGTALAQIPNEWGVPVIDIHHHYRRDVASNLAHVNGAGIALAVCLTDASQDSLAAALPAQRFVRFTSANVARPGFEETLRAAVRSGSRGLGELKSRVAVDGPEMRRVYEIAAELNVPVLIHFQEISQPLSPGTYNTGIDRLESLLKAYPRTTFIGHADAFWANISTEVPGDTTYPTGPVKRGGLTDRLLGDYSNLYGDLSATSGRNALARDPEFSADFVARHRTKLMFGSDCGCADGHGTGQTNPNPLVAGKCVARETLTALKQIATPAVFRRIVSDNAEGLVGRRFETVELA